MKFYKILVVCILFLLAAAFAIWYQPNNKTTGSRVCFGSNCFSIEVVDTPSTREKGLMNRSHLADDSGMLFIFDSEQIYPFWMKNTLIPLDMIWLDKDKKVVFIFNNAVPCEGDPCPIINPNIAAKYVVELNSGTAKNKNIYFGQLADFDIR